MGIKRKGRIPLLDLGQFHSNRSLFVEELRDACHRVGFFLIRHDFQDVADSMLQQTRKFMSRPLEEKNLISYEKSPSFRGYMPLGVENRQGKLDSREQIEWAVEYPQVGKQYPWYERLKGTNPWPDDIQPNLRQSTLAFTKEACYVAECIRDALCLALGLDEKQQSAFISNFEDRPDANELAHWVVKLISYPPVSDSSRQGVGAHTDTNFLTFVLQDTVGGLQAFSNGEWVDVPTQYGSSVLVCNLGEQAQVLSRGYLLATQHRVLANTSGQARISVPVFYNPSLSSSIDPIPMPTLGNLDWQRSKDCQSWERQNNAMLASVGENTFKSLARSHPRVFQKHHNDLKILQDGSISSR